MIPPEDYDKTVRQWIPFAWKMVCQFCGRNKDVREEAMSYAMEGLWAAARKWDPTKISKKNGQTTSFQTYAYWCIRSHILNLFDIKFKKNKKDFITDAVSLDNTIASSKWASKGMKIHETLYRDRRRTNKETTLEDKEDREIIEVLLSQMKDFQRDVVECTVMGSESVKSYEARFGLKRAVGSLRRMNGIRKARKYIEENDLF